MYIILLGIAGLWFLYIAVRNIVGTIRTVKRCSVKVCADILSWTEENDSDNPTRYIPTIQYSYGSQVYKTFFPDGAITWYQKKHRDASDTMILFLDPDDPTVITPESKHYTIYCAIESCTVVGFISIFFALIAFAILFHNM